jgi:DNA-binding CsgD family transcriptional regulator
MTSPRPSFRQDPPLALLIDSGESPSIMRALRMHPVQVELLTSVAAVFDRSYRRVPDLLVLMDNLPDGTWLAALLAATHRWRSAVTVIIGPGKAAEGLTRGELQLLRCLASGKTTTAQLAAELCLSPAGVHSSIGRLTKKLGYGRVQLVLFAYALGLAAREAVEEEDARAGRN